MGTLFAPRHVHGDLYLLQRSLVNGGMESMGGHGSWVRVYGPWLAAQVSGCILRDLLSSRCAWEDVQD